MSRYEFMVIPAPVTARKLTGLTKDQDRFCATITDVMTDMGLAGWDFVGAETLPVHERRMFVLSKRAEKSCLVFRREIERLIDPKPVERTQKVTPKRVARQEVVDRVKSGERRITLVAPSEAPEAEAADDDAPARDDTIARLA
ncbi:MAG: hypothetical protein AAF914_08725 [Pseudomonadota bacterium]